MFFFPFSLIANGAWLPSISDMYVTRKAFLVDFAKLVQKQRTETKIFAKPISPADATNIGRTSDYRLLGEAAMPWPPK
jgi:hypothetical protein